MEITKDYLHFIAEIKQSILKSRYRAAKKVNKEQLMLYFRIGKNLTYKIEKEGWGAKVLEGISRDLQVELPGLRGFSYRNLNNMCKLFNYYRFIESKILEPNHKILENEQITIVQLSTAETHSNQIISLFFKIGFTHHLEILNKTTSIEEVIFYMEACSKNQWTIHFLKHHLKSRLYHQQGTLPNNFSTTLPTEMQQNALNAFKDEYLLDFINIEEDDDEPVLQKAIIHDIKKFLMALGPDFSFIGYNYRLIVGDEEFFIDLLFFHRALQCMVVLELKRGKFKPIYAGQLNFYLNALDDLVKHPHENPSIGIILCKEKSNTIVEYAIKNINKAMGVATYDTSREVPAAYKNLLPEPEVLRRILDT